MRSSKLAVVFLIMVFVASMLPISSGVLADTTPISFTGEEFLGRPTDSSITIKVVPDETADIYYEYGTTSGSYGPPTPTLTATAGEPHEVVIDSLSSNTRYYYRMQYSTDSGSTWIARDEHSFHTQRSTGNTFTFDVITDGHVDIMLGDPDTWVATLSGVASDNPDFAIDLGDTVAMDDASTSVPIGDIAAAE